STTTRSNTGGDIDLNIQDLLLLRNGSQISTTAGDEQFGGDGGNINVNSPDGFIVAFPNENSDITANAFEGNGGNVDIAAFGVFGIEFRDDLTGLSDITASSRFGFDGNVNIETPGIEPNPETVELAEDTQSTEVAQGCQVSGEAAVAFFNIGRGGLPPSPGETLNSKDVIASWIPLVLKGESEVNEKVSRVAKKKVVNSDCRNY
ncbi:MAG: S-layer family protein, partial [Cyanobacteria bacterium P01_H01_bin.150]